MSCEYETLSPTDGLSVHRQFDEKEYHKRVRGHPGYHRSETDFSLRDGSTRPPDN